MSFNLQKQSFENSRRSNVGIYVNDSGCAQIPILDSTESGFLQQNQSLIQTQVRPLNTSQPLISRDPNSYFQDSFYQQMRDNSPTNQSHENLKQVINSFETLIPLSRVEKESIKETGVESFQNYDKKIGCEEDDEGSESSLKSDLGMNSVGGISEIQRDDEKDEDAEEVENNQIEEAEKILVSKPIKAEELINECQIIRSQAINGELLKAYDGLVRIKRENASYFKDYHEDYFPAKYCETLVQFLCCLYEEALQGCLSMEEFYDINKCLIKINFNMSKGNVTDKDPGALYHKIGKCYSELGDNFQAHKYLYKSKELLEKYYKNHPKEQPYLLMNCFSSLAQYHLKYKESTEALTYSRKALSLALNFKTQEERGMAPLRVSLARCYVDCCDSLTFEGNLEEAQKNLDEAKFYLESPKLKGHIMNAKVKRSQAQINLNKDHNAPIDMKIECYKTVKDLYNEAIGIIDASLPPKNKLRKDYIHELEKIKKEEEEYKCLMASEETIP